MSVFRWTQGGWAVHKHGLPLDWVKKILNGRLAKIIGWAILGIILLTVVVQLLYPQDRALPLLRVGGLAVGGQSSKQLRTTFSDYANGGEVTIATPSREWRAKWQDIGLTIDPEASSQVALDYPLWERLIPFSSFIKVMQSRSTQMIALVDSDRLEAFALKVVQEDALAARDATIRVDNGVVIVDEAKNGYVFKQVEVKKQIQRLAIANNSRVRLVPDRVEPIRPAADLAAVAAEAESILSHTVTLTVQGRTYTPERPLVGQWITFVENAQTKKIELQFNNDVMKQYLEGINKDIGIDPGTVTVTLLDDVEVGRTTAPPGKSIAVDRALQDIQKALRADQEQAEVALEITDVPPKINIVRSYSQTSAGLLAIVRDWEASMPGDYGVIVRELGGERRYAEWQPDKKYVTASTFKMFVAYVLLKKVAQGVVNFAQTTDMGWTVDACLTEMIVNSTNPCAVSLLNLLGWGETQRLVQEAGFTSTLIDNGCCEEKHSTVRDETNFLLKLNAGTLLDQAGTERLLSMLKRQVWRGGIPSGVPRGVVVADKVGFYAGYIHDVAIVYAPKGTYILGIMSYGGSNPAMAELSRRVYNFFAM